MFQALKVHAPWDYDHAKSGDRTMPGYEAADDPGDTRMTASYPRRASLAALAILVAAFVALYPYLGAVGLCGSGGCPHASQAQTSAPAEIIGSCVAAIYVASAAALAPGSFCRPASDPRPEEAYLSPDPPPPRLSPHL